jgi:hypothetical protein
MHYVTSRSHRMQKHKFDVMCPGVLVVQSIPVPPQHKKYYVDVLCSRRTGMHYMTHSSHQMQNHKFGITFPGMLFVEP